MRRTMRFHEVCCLALLCATACRETAFQGSASLSRNRADSGPAAPGTPDSTSEVDDILEISCGSRTHTLRGTTLQGIDIPNNCITWSDDGGRPSTFVDLVVILDASPNMAHHAASVAPGVSAVIEALRSQGATVSVGGVAFEDEIREVVPLHAGGEQVLNRLNRKAPLWFQDKVGLIVNPGAGTGWMQHDAPNLGLTAIETALSVAQPVEDHDLLFMYMSNAPARGNEIFSVAGTAEHLRNHFEATRARRGRMAFLYAVNTERLTGLPDTFFTSAVQADFLFSRAGIPATKVPLPLVPASLQVPFAAAAGQSSRVSQDCPLRKVSLISPDGDRLLFMQEFTAMPKSGSTRVKPNGLPGTTFQLVISRECGAAGESLVAVEVRAP